MYTIVWQIHSLSLFYKSEGIDEVDKQRLRLVKRVMGGTGGKNPPSSKEKPVKETFIPPELSMVTFFMTKVRERDVLLNISLTVNLVLFFGYNNSYS